MRSRSALIAWLAMAFCAPLGAAQQASPYVPMSHWAMPFIEHLIAAGVIMDPTPDTRPLKQSQVVQALERADTTALSPRVRATIRRLIDEWAPADPAPHYRIESNVGAQAATYAFRDPLELDRGIPGHALGQRGFGNGGVDAEFWLGPAVAVSHLAVDTRLEFDPDWSASVNTATRFEEAYLSAQWRVGEVFFGILDRNWGPSGIQGVLLSSNPYSLDHFALTLGTPGFQLQTWAAELDPRKDSTGATENRYMLQNRLWIHPRGRWTATLEAADIIAGPGRPFDLWYLNPATISFFRASNQTEVNNFLDVDFERRARMTLFGQFMLDDIQVSRNSASDLKPASFALTIGAKGRLASAATTWTLFYTQVSTLTYRNDDNEEVPQYFGGVGIGRQFDDYDQATAKVNLLFSPTLLLTPEIDVLRQGQGDPHLLHPLPPQYTTTAVLFQGIVERIVHLALGGSWKWHGVTVSGTAGVDFIENANNVTGASQTPFLGSIAVTYRFHHEARLP